VNRALFGAKSLKIKAGLEGADEVGAKESIKMVSHVYEDKLIDP
jgi:hypothetical protein